MGPVRRTFILACLATALAALVPAVASAASLGSRLAAAMRPAGGASGAYVVNATSGQPVLRYRHTTPRILASNTKLYTTAAALARYGVAGRLSTEVRGTGTLEEDGTYRGDLYLVGAGDPTFGSSTFARRSYGGGASVQGLATALEGIGVRRVTGRVYGDESKFDSLRGGPDSRYGISPYVGPAERPVLQPRPGHRERPRLPVQPARPSPPPGWTARWPRPGISVKGAPRAKRTPGGATPLVKVSSPTMARLAALTNKPSDNFFAEMLVKDLALQANGKGTTKAGARLAAGFAKRLGAGPAGLTDGSGLSRGNRASPQRVANLLLAMRKRDEFAAFNSSLSVAGRDGTLGPRMRGGAAQGRCRGKTGTISGVTAVSGYCTARSGQVYVYSILMNGVNAFGGRAIQDRMLNAIAASG